MQSARGGSFSWCSHALEQGSHAPTVAKDNAIRHLAGNGSIDWLRNVQYALGNAMPMANLCRGIWLEAGFLTKSEPLGFCIGSHGVEAR